MDKSAPMVLDALNRAVLEPGGLPLFAGKQLAGLFASSASARHVAQQCKDDGLLQIVRSESRGKAVQEICAITEKGVAYLLAQSSPKQIIEQFLRALDTRGREIQHLQQTVQLLQESLEGMRTAAEKLVRNLQEPAVNGHAVENGVDVCMVATLSFLAERQRASAMQDYPLPDLYRKIRENAPTLSIGRFHDGLRKLHQQEQIYLHPWTGPLYDIPEPALALLVGHEVVYYASRRGTPAPDR